MDFDNIKANYMNANCSSATFVKDCGIDAYETLKTIPRETKYTWMMETLEEKIQELQELLDITPSILVFLDLLPKVKGETRYALAKQIIDTIEQKTNFYFIDKQITKQVVMDIIDPTLKDIMEQVLYLN